MSTGKKALLSSWEKKKGKEEAGGGDLVILSLDSSHPSVLWSRDLKFGSFVLGLQFFLLFFFFFPFVNLFQFGFEGKK